MRPRPGSAPAIVEVKDDELACRTRDRTTLFLNTLNSSALTLSATWLPSLMFLARRRSASHTLEYRLVSTSGVARKLIAESRPAVRRMLIGYEPPCLPNTAPAKSTDQGSWTIALA